MGEWFEDQGISVIYRIRYIRPRVQGSGSPVNDLE
jgi:hypothetical protein